MNTITDHPVRRRVGIAVAAVVSVAALGTAAFAHTHVAESSPASGERVDSPPAEVMVRFGDEFAPVQPGAVTDAYLEVYDACGKQVDNKDSSLTVQDSRVVVTSGGEVSGRYEIHWHATAADGASQSGVIDFHVKKGPDCASVVRTDPADDVDLGTDVIGVKAVPGRKATLISVETTAPVGCSDLKGGQSLQLFFDTNADQAADIDGKVLCRDGTLVLKLRSEDGRTGILRVSRPAASVLAVRLARHPLLGHVDVYAMSSLDSDECDGKVCTDRAPDLGSVRAF